MPKKKQAKKGKAAKGGKASSGKTKPVVKTGTKAAKGGKKVTSPKGSAKKPVDLASLKANVAEAKTGLTRAENEGDALRMQAKGVEGVAKKAYAAALIPYRDACRKAGVPCEFTGFKAPPVAPRVRFLIEKVKGGVKVAIKDRPESEEVLPDKVLASSVWRAADDYCKRQFGKTPIGAKARGLANRLRAIRATQ